MTSSSPVAGAAAVGIGIGPNRIDAIIGVAKAYVTRVGEGPFPTEIEGPDQERVRELGGEFGTTTGRERRCGWLDLVALRYAVRLNGITSLALTKLDVLSAFDELPVCVALPAARRHGDAGLPGTPERLPPLPPGLRVAAGLGGAARRVRPSSARYRTNARALRRVRRARARGDGRARRHGRRARARAVAGLARSAGPAQRGARADAASRLAAVKVLVVGSGGREHALAWKLSQSPGLEALHAAPGNPGIAALGECHPVRAEDGEGLLSLGRELDVDLVVVGPEAPLVAGLADALRRAGIAVFGPTAAAARIEGSKGFAKDVHERSGRPDGATVSPSPVPPCVVKADGLAAGKGVFVCRTQEELDAGLRGGGRARRPTS